MLKFIFRLIGIIVVLIILVTAILFFFDSKDFLSGKLGRLVGSLRQLSREAWNEIRIFVSTTGIEDEAAGLLDQGAEFFRGSVKPHPTEKPGSHPYSPSPEYSVTPHP